MAQMEINVGGSKIVSSETLIQTPSRIKFRTEWENGFILITDQQGGEAYIDPSHKLIRQPDGTFNIDFSSPNPNFIDSK